MKTVTPALLALATLIGCGGADPAPRTPADAAPPAAAPARSPEAACNELAVGIGALSAFLRMKDSPGTSAGALRLMRRSIDSFTTLRAQVKHAVELDPSLSTEATPLDATIASEVASLDAVAKLIETEAKAMREIVADVEKLRLGFSMLGCTKKDDDCTGRMKVSIALVGLAWTVEGVQRTRAELTKIDFKAPELVTRRTELVKRLDEAERTLTDGAKQMGAIRTAAEAKRADLKEQSTALYKRCNITEAESADNATKRPQWVTSSTPDLRKMVMVVRVLPEGRIRARLEEWASSSTGVKREVFAGATQGGFGSGFFVMPKPGEVYVVTNRHVVDYGDRATLQMGDGTAIAADILYTDPHADLAVLKPDPKADLKITYGLGLDPDPAKDQQVVIATGYPGLGTKPSYQTTKGYVSNQRFADSFDGSIYIQHTAPVDRGGSGGPLTSERNLVLGVNTLKIRERENVAMSVPALQVANAIAHVQQKTDVETLRKEAKDACLDVMAELGDLSPRVLGLYQRISLSMVAESGSSAYNAIADRELAEMMLEDPIDALRASIVERLLRDAQLYRLNPFELCNTPNADDLEHILTMDRVRFQVRVGTETKDLTVRRELGRFQLLRFDMAPPLPPMPAKPLGPAKPAKPAKPAPPAKKKKADIDRVN